MRWGEAWEMGAANNLTFISSLDASFIVEQYK
jgi:hypothetical protein